MNNSLYLLATICFIAMLSPGPDFILVTKNSIIYPKKQALATALGVISGCLFHSTYCVLGLALIITKSTVFFAIIKYAGACYLIYLGINGLRSKKKETFVNDTYSGQNATVLKAFLEGFYCNVLNPKLAVFLLSLFTQFVGIDASIADKAVVAGIFICESALYWPALVIILQSRGMRLLFSNFRVVLNRVCGSLLIFLGLRVML